jgi:hypothetical protein
MIDRVRRSAGRTSFRQRLSIACILSSSTSRHSVAQSCVDCARISKAGSRPQVPGGEYLNREQCCTAQQCWTVFYQSARRLLQPAAGPDPGFPLPQRFTETRGTPTSIAASVLLLARHAGTALWDVLPGRCAGVRCVPIGIICAAIARIARTSAGRADIKIPARTGANVQPLRLDRWPCFQYP